MIIIIILAFGVYLMIQRFGVIHPNKTVQRTVSGVLAGLFVVRRLFDLELDEPEATVAIESCVWFLIFGVIVLGLIGAANRLSEKPTSRIAVVVAVMASMSVPWFHS